MNVQDILEERGKTHGDFTDNAMIAQALKEIMRQGKNWNELPDTHKEALEMIAHKIARWLSGDYRYNDNMKDIIGYTTLVLERLNKR